MSKREQKTKLLATFVHVAEQLDKARLEAKKKRQTRWAITAPSFLKFVR